MNQKNELPINWRRQFLDDACQTIMSSNFYGLCHIHGECCPCCRRQVLEWKGICKLNVAIVVEDCHWVERYLKAQFFALSVELLSKSGMRAPIMQISCMERELLDIIGAWFLVIVEYLTVSQLCRVLYFGEGLKFMFIFITIVLCLSSKIETEFGFERF